MQEPTDDRIDAIVQRAKHEGARLVRFLYCDACGITRGKATHITRLAQRMREGIGLTVAMMAMNSLDRLATVPGMTAVGEIRLLPDPNTYVPLPYIPNASSLLCDMYTYDRQPWDGDPRSFLRRMVRQASDQDLFLQVGFENEFFLLTPEGQPVDRHLCFSALGLDSVAAYTDDLVRTLEQQGLPVEQYYVEYGPGQQELSLSPADALTAADRQMTVRETIRGVALQHNLLASLAPKPFPDTTGSGAHVHMSIWDPAGERNLFYDPHAPDGLSALARNWMGGLLAHLPGLVALACPSVNSYRRLQPQTWSSCFSCYGYDNREAPLRVASSYWGREMASTNLEMKTVDNTANPYLALGGIIAAGLDGIARKLDPGEPVQVDPATIPADERELRGIHRLPATLGDALEALQGDHVLMDALGPLLGPAYQIVKRSEVEAYAGQDLDFELAGHLNKY